MLQQITGNRIVGTHGFAGYLVGLTVNRASESLRIAQA